VTLHECRHTFATLMIAAGVNAKALQTFMGHSSITVALDRYGHLFPGSGEEAANLLDAYLADAHERARQAEIAPCGESAGKNAPERGGSERRKAVSSAANRKPPRPVGDEKPPQITGMTTERGGFEPPKDRKALTGFRDRRIQPLCHLSRSAPDKLDDAACR
jgi:hypothetical protein